MLNERTQLTDGSVAMSYSWEDSKYYKVTNDWIENGVSIIELARRSLDLLDEELSHPEIYGLWLVYHFDSTADYLIENIDYLDDDHSEDEIEELVEIAKAEIEIFKRHGYDALASQMQDILDEVIEYRQ